MSGPVKASSWIIGALSTAFIAGGIALLESPSLHPLALQVIAILRDADSVSFWSDKLQWVGVELVVLGIIFLAGSQIVIYKEIYLAKNWRQTAVTATAMIVLVALWLPIIIFGHSAEIGGERYWWLGDDAMISMRYAHNLANGDGLVWNAGEYIEGYT
ncbi:hypothetical protein KKA08_00960, partial [bacterium]|nr:hypothetical protein [bacterium]